MTVHLTNNSELRAVFSASELTTLLELGQTCRLWQDETDNDSKISALFSRAEIHLLNGISLVDHLLMVEKMFPVSKYPDVWRKMIAGPVQETPSDEVSFAEPLCEKLGLEDSRLTTGWMMTEATADEIKKVDPKCTIL